MQRTLNIPFYNELCDHHIVLSIIGCTGIIVIISNNITNSKKAPWVLFKSSGA